MGTLFNKKPIPEGWANPLETWRGWERAQGQRTATIDTKLRHLAYFARCNPNLRPEDLTVEYALAWSATQDWMPETRHGYYGSFQVLHRMDEQHHGTKPYRRDATGSPTPDQGKTCTRGHPSIGAHFK